MAFMFSAAGVFRLVLPLAFVVVVAGAYTRIADAGLGCPDWPGCYGKLIGVPSAAEADDYLSGGDNNAESNGENDDGNNAPAYDRKKAAIEIAHRYIAGLLGLLIFAGAFLAWREKKAAATAINKAKAKAAAALAVLVCAQALLGMITVTDNLRPVVVVAHLLGGMLILFVLARLAFARDNGDNMDSQKNNNRVFAAIAVLVLFGQIALGGWVSANYAGLACGDFPLCQGGWMPHSADFSGFDPRRELHKTPDGAQVSNAALATMHWLHRIGAIVAFMVLSAFALLRWRGGRRLGGGVLLVLLAGQITLGIVVVLLRLPVAVALLHNVAAALLVINIAVLSARR